MQRTLFDFDRKTPRTSTTVIAAVGAGEATAASPTAALACSDTNGASAIPTRKRARPRSENSSSGNHAGTSREAPIDLEENSRSVVAVDDESEGAVPRTTSTPEFNGGPTHTQTASVPAQQQRLLTQKSPSPARPSHGRSPQAHAPASSSRWLADLITSPEWKSFLQPITADAWRNGDFARIERFLDGEQAKGKVVLPPAALLFNAFNSCPFAELKVVLLGQDPYHNLNQAHGLCFSVLPGVPLPPSLRNMYKELTTDIPGFQAPTHGYLQSWSEQGMLMLNATLTVEAHNANSHSKTSGWQHFTDAVIARLSAHHPNRLVFLLWGNAAQRKKTLIDTVRHVVIESVHPSPLSAARGWFGCHCFSACNTALRAMGHTPMYWQLPLQVQQV